MDNAAASGGNNGQNQGGYVPMKFQLNSLIESEGGKKQIKIRNF
jgi:hypothetical protein